MNKQGLSKFYSNYQLYIFPIIIIISCLILIIFIIFPQTAKLISNSRLEKEIKNKSQALEAKASVLESYDEKDLSNKVDISLYSYPAERDFASVLGLLQQLTIQSGFNILTLSLGGGIGNKYGNSESYSVKAEVLGPKTTFTNLINSIENSNRIMRISSIDITTSKDNGVIDTVLGIEVLYSSLPSSFGTVDSPLPQLSEKDEELITKLARVPQAIQTPSSLVPRGKANPFE